MVSLFFSLVAAAVTVSVSARPPKNWRRGALGPIARPPRAPIPDTGVPVTDVNGTVIPPYNTIYTFDQLIDHNNPSAGTFTQRYYHTWERYVPGGPIIVFCVGELNMEGYQGYLTNKTMPGRFAQENGGATIVLEHRFFGLSNPKPDLTDESLKLLTLQQSVDDLSYFANNVKLAMPGGDQVKPSQAPWVLTGGSYSGALTSWVMNTKKEFWAGYSSSGVVQAIRDWWGYFEVVRQSGPKNCTADIARVIEYVDTTFKGGNKAKITALKNNWGMGTIQHLDDVAGALRYNLWDWQGLDPNSSRDASFYQFCDALETKNGVVAGANGWGLDHALQAWGKFWNETYYPALGCDDQSVVDCIGTYDPTQEFWHDTEIDNYSRSWTWMTCKEIGYNFDGAPKGWPTLTSRLITPSYNERMCTYYFNQTYTRPTPATTEHTNKVFKGWNSKAQRLFFANGQRDPWREATMSTDFVKLKSTDLQPIAISDGFHCNDLIISQGTKDASIKQVQDLASAYMGKWISAWHTANPSRPHGHHHDFPDPSKLPRPAFSREDIPASIVNASAAADPNLPATGASKPGAKSAFHVIPDAMVWEAPQSL